MKVCIQPGCPELTTATRCPTHQRQRDRARGSRQARGYNATHVALRKQWAPRVATGTVNCWRCGQPIHPDEPWDLGHRDDHTYGGPEHQHCNRAAGGRASHG